MAKIDIVSTFRDYATAQGWAFWFGDDQYQNIFSRKISTGAIAKDTIIFAMDIGNYGPTIIGDYGTIENQVWSISVLLARKFDPGGTFSKLDEDTIDKWDLRIKPLNDLLETMFEDLSCKSDIEFSGVSLGYRINLFDPNVDGAFGTFTVSNIQV